MKRHKGNAKLTAQQAIEICRLYSTGKFSQGALGRAFHVTAAQIGRIVRGEVWATETGMDEDVLDEEQERAEMPPALERHAPMDPAAEASLARFAAKHADLMPRAAPGPGMDALSCTCGQLALPRNQFPYVEGYITHRLDQPCFTQEDSQS